MHRTKNIPCCTKNNKNMTPSPLFTSPFLINPKKFTSCLLLPTPSVPYINNNIVPLKANSPLKEIRTCRKVPNHSKDITLNSLSADADRESHAQNFETRTTFRFHIPTTILLKINVFWYGRLRLKCDTTQWRMGEEVKGKLANGVGSQYFSHYLRTWCIKHYYRWCAHLGSQ